MKWRPLDPATRDDAKGGEPTLFDGPIGFDSWFVIDDLDEDALLHAPVADDEAAFDRWRVARRR